MPMHKAKKILLLGKGYVTESFQNFASDYLVLPDLSITSREVPDCIYFKLEDQTSWDNIQDDYDACVWTFPVYDLSLFQQFYRQKKHLLSKIILLGTTSSYKIDHDQQRVDEFTALDPQHKRYLVENYLLQQQGVVLRCAGIYGPGKNPIDWVKQGKIKSPVNSYVNWVHVFDLVQFIAHAILYGKNGHSYIAADGCPVKWQELYDYFQVFPPKGMEQQKKQSKKINNQWTISELKINLAYPGILTTR